MSKISNFGLIRYVLERINVGKHCPVVDNAGAQPTSKAVAQHNVIYSELHTSYS